MERSDGHPAQAGDLAENAAQSNELRILASTLPATASHKRWALITCLVFVTGFVGSAPFAQMPVAQFPAVIALLQAVQVTADLIIAGLLFAQYYVQRSRELTILAAGFLFTSLIVVAHTLTFPGVVSETGAFSAGPQSAAWIVVAWRVLLPLTVIAYALRQDGSQRESRERSRTDPCRIDRRHGWGRRAHVARHPWA